MMKSVIVDKVHIKAMLKALREAGAPIQSTSTTHEVKGKNGTIFWAMTGPVKLKVHGLYVTRLLFDTSH